MFPLLMSISGQAARTILSSSLTTNKTFSREMLCRASATIPWL